MITSCAKFTETQFMMMQPEGINKKTEKYYRLKIRYTVVHYNNIVTKLQI